MTKILASVFLVSLLAACSSMGSYGGADMRHSTAMGAPASQATQTGNYAVHANTLRNGDGPN